MASQQHPTTMENLPSDVLSNIFIKLLAKQLAQMRSVSKSMNALLSKKSFIKSHLHHSIQNHDKILMIFHKLFEFGPEPFTAHPSPSPHEELTNFIKFPVNLRSEGANVIGSVNGLICLNYNASSGFLLHVWNPSLSAVLTLPPYSMLSCGYDQIQTRTLFRFGFDPKTDDYKVVKLVALLETPGIEPIMVAFLGVSLISVKEWLQVEVYSLRNGSWALITQRFPSHITGILRQDEVCVDGHDGRLHWLCCDEVGKQQIIVAFDLGDETFCEIRLPDSILDCTVSYRYNVLGVLGGKLCVMSKVGVLECEVWVMDEYGVAESWVKHHAFSQFSGDIFPYGFTSHSEFLFQVDDRFGLYDQIAAKVKIFKTRGIAFTVVKIVDYVDSLVWVAPSRDISYFDCKFERIWIFFFYVLSELLCMMLWFLIRFMSTCQVSFASALHPELLLSA